MDYFSILNLKKEPFSNSPKPEFFYRSAMHQECIDNLEIAVRLKRGLNVVIGDVGTGKTTLCRQFLTRLSGADDGDAIGTHLILDPSFNTPMDFLWAVADTLGAARGDSERQSKENIKNHLFKKGVAEGKLVVLIIDEGQKLPVFCLEILREFLNYETNNHKLLQIAIFAQEEFIPLIKNHDNFADRINTLCFLKPLTLRDTRRMVNFRLARASDGDKPPTLFTWGGMLAVYLATWGYPRKIVTLCHTVVLALIIQNRPRAGWRLVWSCASKGFFRQSMLQSILMRKVRWDAAALVAVLPALLFVAAPNSGFETAERPWQYESPKTDSTQPSAQAPEKAPDTPDQAAICEGGAAEAIYEDFGGQLTANTQDFDKLMADLTPSVPMPEKAAQPLDQIAMTALLEQITTTAEIIPSAQAPEKALETADHMAPHEGAAEEAAGNRTYGEFSEAQFTTAAKARPPIQDFNKFVMGDKLYFPAISPALNQVKFVSAPNFNFEVVNKPWKSESPVTADLPPSAQTPEGAPETLGQVAMNEGATVSGASNRIYGGFSEEQFAAIAKANPQIQDFNKLLAGKKLTFPAIPSSLEPVQPGGCWVQLAKKNSLEEAYRLIDRYPRHYLRLLPYWNNSEGLVFAILLNGSFPDEAAAFDSLNKLPPQAAASAGIVNHWKEETVFFSSKP